MISIEEALKIIETHLPTLPHETVELSEAAGRILAETIAAPEPAPRYDNSAMDGYALRYEDVAGCAKEQPISLRLVGESRAGVPFAGRVGVGEAVRISTGAMVPSGADTVVRLEDAEEEDGVVRILACQRQGQDIRFRGEEFAAGDPLLAKGTFLGPAQLALCAAVGIERLTVHPRPRIALLVTGTELAPAAGRPVAAHQIRDSNTIMLAAAVREAGGRLVLARHIDDDPEATAAAIGEAAEQADILLCSGGVSVGRHDHVKEAALVNGFRQGFWRIRQKPGKPLFFAYQDHRLLFGLPGNPVSAFICFFHYVRPAVTALAGRAFGHPVVKAVAGTEISCRGRRPTLLRVSLDKGEGAWRAFPVTRQGSHMLTSLTTAQGYALVQPGTGIAAGEQMKVVVFNQTLCCEG